MVLPRLPTIYIAAAVAGSTHPVPAEMVCRRRPERGGHRQTAGDLHGQPARTTHPRTSFLPNATRHFVASSVSPPVASPAAHGALRGVPEDLPGSRADSREGTTARRP